MHTYMLISTKQRAGNCCFVLMMNAVCEKQLAWQTTDPVKNVGLSCKLKKQFLFLYSKKNTSEVNQNTHPPTSPPSTKKEDEKMLLVSNIQ